MTNDPEVTSSEKVKIKVPRALHAKFLLLQYLLRGRLKVRAARIKRWKRRIAPPSKHLGLVVDMNTVETIENSRWIEPIFWEGYARL